MKRRDIVVGLVVIAIFFGYVYWRSSTKPVEDLTIPETLSVEDQIEDAFKVDIPEDVDKAELLDVTGGNGSGLATRKFEKGTFIHTVLVDLPDPEAGEFYEAWLVKGDDVVPTGKLRIAKGGYLLDFSLKTDLSEYNKVLVSLEKVSDITPEKHILEGSF